MTDSPQVGTRLKCPECAGEIIVVKPPRSARSCSAAPKAPGTSGVAGRPWNSCRPRACHLRIDVARPLTANRAVSKLAA